MNLTTYKWFQWTACMYWIEIENWQICAIFILFIDLQCRCTCLIWYNLPSSHWGYYKIQLHKGMMFIQNKQVINQLFTANYRNCEILFIWKFPWRFYIAFNGFFLSKSLLDSLESLNMLRRRNITLSTCKWCFFVYFSVLKTILQELKYPLIKRFTCSLLFIFFAAKICNYYEKNLNLYDKQNSDLIFFPKRNMPVPWSWWWYMQSVQDYRNIMKFSFNQIVCFPHPKKGGQTKVCWT